MTRLVAIGWPVPEVVRAQPPVLAFPRGLGRRALLDLAEELLRAADNREQTLVIQPAWDLEPGLERLQLVRTLLDIGGVATYATSLPPLAASALCGVTAALGARGVPAGVLWEGLPALERQLLTVARLDRVAAFRHPRPPARTRLASYLPAIAFALSTWPHAHARRLRPDQPEVALPPPVVWDGLPARRVLVTQRSGPAAEWFEAYVLPLLGEVEVVEVDAPPLTPAYWGTAGVLEAVAAPADLEALRALLPGFGVALCTWCGAEVVSPRCPFCGASQERGLPVRVRA